MYNKKNVDYVALVWEDFMYQAENREINSARKEHMPYPRFTKVIINHFISKDKTISMWNKINLHTIRDDSLLDIKYSKAYKTYYDFVTGKVPPKKERKYKKVASPLRKLSHVLEEEPAEKPKKTKKPAKKSTTVPTIGVVIRDTPGVPVSKKKAPAKGDKVGSQPKVDSCDDGSNDDDSDDVTKNDDEDDVESDANEDKEASDSEKTDSDKYGNLNVNQNDDEEEEHEEEYICTPDSFEFNDDDEKLLMKNQAPPNLSVPVTAILETSTVHVTIVPLIIQPLSSIPQMSTPTPIPTTELMTSSIPALPEFASLFGFNQRVTRNGFAAQTALQSYAAEFEKKAQAEKEKYIDVIEKSVKEIIKDEVKSQLPQILPKEIFDFTTPKILLDNLEKIKSYRAAEQHRDLYDALIKSYQLDKDLFDSYGKTYSLKRCHEDKDKDEDPPAGSDQGLTKRKISKDVEPSRGSKSKESKSSSSKGSKSQSKSSGMSAQAEEPVFETADTDIPQDQGDNLGNTEDQPNVEEASKHDWFKKPERPLTPDHDWNAGKQIDFRPHQTWISKMAKAGKPPTTFDELMSTPIDFSAYVLHNLKIESLTQEHLVGPAFNLLKGTCKSQVELEIHFEECYKAVTDKLDWTNPEGHEYPFDLSKPLPLIEDQGRQVVPANYFFNNDLEYLKGESLSSEYTTSTTKTKDAKYDTIEGIEYMVPLLWSPVKHDVLSTKRIIEVTHIKVVKKYDYGYLDEIIVRREDQQLYKFVEGDFPRLNLRDIEDMLLLLVQKKLSNLERDYIFYLNVELRMFTRRVVILKRVEDL
ncbi:hypothetical protein Tco_0468588 [Tanacetum coccineum]